jgi:hypothetical protein
MKNDSDDFGSSRHWRTLLFLLLGICALHPQNVRAQGIAYEISPLAAQFRWDEALGLRDDNLLGARLGLRFGRLAEVHGFYMTRPDVQASAAALPIVPGFVPPGAEQQVGIQSYGADLRLNLLSGSLVPYLMLGGGVVRFNPDNLESTDQILLKAGGGARFRFFRNIGADIFVENWAFRLNRYRFFVPPGVIEDPEVEELRHSLALGAGLNIPLGGDITDTSPGLRGAAITVEPIGGRLDFADELNLARQNLLGVRAGLDLNRLVGVRGFFWRGINEDFNEATPIQGYGGEVQLNLGAGTGIVPHLLAGAGQINFREGYTDLGGAVPTDRTALILGGGVSFSLSERLRGNASVRDYIIGVSEEFGDVRRTDQLLHSLLLSAGLSFAVGGRTFDPARVEQPVLTDLEALRLENERLRREAEAEALRRENERLRQFALGEPVQGQRVQERVVVVDTMVIEVDAVTGDTVARYLRPADPAPAAAAPAAPQRTMVVPIPEQGEIYIRFGEPGNGLPIRIQEGAAAGVPTAPAAAAGVPAAPAAAAGGVGALSPAQLSTLIRDAVRDEVRLQTGALAAPAAPGTGLAEAQRLDLLEQRLLQRIDNTLARQLAAQDRRLAQLEGALRGRAGQTTVIVPERQPIVVAPPPAGYVDPRFAPPVVDPRDPLSYVAEPPRSRFEPRYIRPYMGANVNNPTQFVFGSRLDLGPVIDDIPLFLVPEAALGFGDDVTSVLVGGNLQYEFNPVAALAAATPYVHVGLGLWHADRTRVLGNYGLGASFPVGVTPAGPIRIFVEQQGLGLFGRMRLLVGSQVVY